MKIETPAAASAKNGVFMERQREDWSINPSRDWKYHSKNPRRPPTFTAPSKVGDAMN